MLFVSFSIIINASIPLSNFTIVFDAMFVFNGMLYDVLLEIVYSNNPLLLTIYAMPVSVMTYMS